MSAPAGSIVLEAWRGTDELAQQEEDWTGLLAELDVDPLCNGPAWTLPYLAAFVPPNDTFGWTARAASPDEPGACVALLPFRIEPSRGALSLTRALLATDGTFDSDYLDLLIRPGFEEEVLHRMVDAFREVRRVQAVVLSGLPSESRVLAALRAVLGARRLPSQESPVDCLATSLAGSFDDLLARLKPRMRSKVRQALRAAEEDGATFHWCTDHDELDRELEGLFALHEQRWEGSGGRGGFADERRRAFYRRAAREFLSCGKLRLARLDAGGEAVAYQIGLVAGSTYYQLQEGFDPSFTRLRAGIALRALGLERLIDEGITSYDFMAGEARHKRDWAAEPRPCTTIAFALPRWRGRLAYGLRNALNRR